MSEAGESGRRWDCIQAGVWAASYRVPMFDSRTLAICLEALQEKAPATAPKAGRTWILTSPGPDLVPSFKAELFGDQDRVAGLIVPSSYHNLGLHAFQAEFPQAQIVAAPSGHKRLAARGFNELAESLDLLDAYGVQLHALPGSKNGELWLSVKHPESPLLAVGDAIFNLKPGGSLGFRLFKLICQAGPGLKMDLPYRLLFLEDKQVFKTWAQHLFKTLQPKTFVPVHGEILRAPHLGPAWAQFLPERQG